VKHIICYSGGVESALATIEVARKFGTKNMVLLNHDISPDAEEPDIKQYKQDIADYLGVEVTYCNAVTKEYKDFDPILGAIARRKFKGPNGDYCTFYLKSEPFNLWLDPILKCVESKAWKVGQGTELCCSRIKTEPFHEWLKDKDFDFTVYYGFTRREWHRIERRYRILKSRGIKSDYPLTWRERTIFDTAEIGIPKPKHYDIWKHGNCAGCLKAGWQHWYCVYVHRPDRWELAKQAEEIIGYSILRRNSKPCFLKEREREFYTLWWLGLPATEHIKAGKFWAMARKLFKEKETDKS
jgi:hypothetical protein